MIIDDFVARFRFEPEWDAPPYAVCPWCDWHYDMPSGGLMADVLRDLGEHMTSRHRDQCGAP